MSFAKRGKGNRGQGGRVQNARDGVTIALCPCERTHAGGRFRALRVKITRITRVFPAGSTTEGFAVSWFVEKSGLEFFGPYNAEELLGLFHKGEISIFSLVRKAEIRPVEYQFFGEILLEIEPKCQWRPS